MIALAGLAGGLVVTGLLMLVRELAGHRPGPGIPKRRRPWRLAPVWRLRVMLAVTAGVLVLAISRWPVAAVAAVLAVVFLPGLTSGKSARQRVAVLEGLEQWIRRVSDMLTASRGLEDALGAAASSAPAAVAPAVQRLADRLRASGDAEAALRAFAAEIDDPAADRIAAALVIATGRRGGSVRGVLGSLATLLARDVAVRRDIEAERAQHRTTVRWLVGFVLAFTVFAVLNRSYSAPYATPAGEAVLAAVLVLYAGGLAWLHHLGAVPVPGRFLDGEGTEHREPR
jgi:Flp pilus assembly protein TadB